MHYKFVKLDTYTLTYKDKDGKEVTIARRSELKYSKYAKSYKANRFRLRDYDRIGRGLRRA